MLATIGALTKRATGFAHSSAPTASAAPATLPLAPRAELDHMSDRESGGRCRRQPGQVRKEAAVTIFASGRSGSHLTQNQAFDDVERAFLQPGAVALLCGNKWGSLAMRDAGCFHVSKSFSCAGKGKQGGRSLNFLNFRHARPVGLDDSR